MNYMNVARRSGAVVVGTLILASTAMADTAADVTAAVTSGTTTVQLVVGGVIALAALAFGLGMMKNWLSK